MFLFPKERPGRERVSELWSAAVPPGSVPTSPVPPLRPSHSLQPVKIHSPIPNTLSPKNSSPPLPDPDRDHPAALQPPPSARPPTFSVHASPPPPAAALSTFATTGGDRAPRPSRRETPFSSRSRPGCGGNPRHIPAHRCPWATVGWGRRAGIQQQLLVGDDSTHGGPPSVHGQPSAPLTPIHFFEILVG